MPFTSSLKLEILLHKSGNSLYTLRTPNQTFAALISGLLGSVFGIMGVFRAVMEYVEENRNRRKEKLKSDEKEKEVYKNRGKILEILELEEEFTLSPATTVRRPSFDKDLDGWSSEFMGFA